MLLVRKEGAVPTTPADGVTILGQSTPVKTDYFTDRTAKSGRRYGYGVFSVFEGRTSDACRSCFGFRQPLAVSHLQATFDGRAIELRWQTPAGCKQVLVFRATADKPGFATDSGHVKVSGDCHLVVATSSVLCRDDSFRDDVHYYYHAIADYGDGIFAEPAMTEAQFGRPQLVTGLEAQAHRDRVLLKWTRPAAKCDCLDVVRNDSRSPMSPKDGVIVAERTTEDHCEDGNVSPGKRYFYGVFSHFRDVVSASCMSCRGYVAPEPVRQFKVRHDGRAVSLTWERPPGCQRVWVFRSRTRVDAFPVRDGCPCPPAAVERIGKAEKYEESEAKACIDTTFESGQQYYYYALAEHRDGMFSEPVDVMFRYVESRLVDELIAVPGPDSVELRWKLPAEKCDSVAVIANEKQPPAAMEDGLLVFRGRRQEYHDARPPAGQRRHYAVFSFRDGVPSSRSQVCSGYRIPEGVRGFRGTFRDARVRLEWEPPLAGAVELYRSCEPGAISRTSAELVLRPGCQWLGTPSAAEFADADYFLGEKYCYYAVVDFGDGVYSEVAETTVEVPLRPLRPAEPKVEFQPRRIELLWEPGAADTNYHLFRHETENPPDVASAPASWIGGRTWFVDDQLQCGRPYWYTLVAERFGLLSEPVTAGPYTAFAEAEQFQGQPLPGAVRLRWSLPAGVEQAQLEREPNTHNPGCTWILPGAATRFLDRGLLGQEPVQYRLRLRFGTAWSGGVVDSWTPAPPRGLVTAAAETGRQRSS